jgi:hypothetical protein
MKIAIIDGVNQDIGLKILFPNADYFIYTKDNQKHNNLNIRTDTNNITDKNYDYIFIIISLYDTKINTRFYKQNINDMLNKELEIIKNNNFKKVFVFDNYDYDYDPNDIIQCDKIDIFFKRNYNKKKQYKKNVVPFPFIMFGEVSLIEKMLQHNFNSNIEKLNRIFFTGTLFYHNDEQLNYVRDRRSIYSKIKKYIYNPGRLPYNKFISEIRNSKYSLDLNGVGDPNKRTFEILSQGSLMISEYNDLKWPFQNGDEFNDELKFKDEKEFYKIMDKLNKNTDFYMKCLENQNYIFNKYFNVDWIRDYILGYTM